MASLHNLVRVYTATVGAGAVTLGAAVPGFLTFVQGAVPDGATVSYAIREGNNSETGRGVYTLATQNLTRVPNASTNGGAAIVLAGAAELFITGLAEDFLTDAQIAALHPRQHAVTSALDHTSTATPGRILQADANGLPVDATNTDAQVSAAVTASHARSHAITSNTDHTSAATPNQMLKADANGLPVDATNTDAQVSAAVSASHAAVTLAADHGLGLAGQQLNMGTPSNVSSTSTNSVSGATHTHALSADVKEYQADSYAFGFVTDYSGAQQTTIAFDGVNTFTLAKTGATWSYYRNGTKYTIAVNKTVDLALVPPATKGLYYIFIDAVDGTLTASTAGWSLEDTKVPVATINWDNSLTPKYWMSDERHTVAITRRFHWEHHFSDGTEVISAPVLTGYSIAPAVPTNANNAFKIGQAITSDEDLKHILAELPDPEGLSADYVTYYPTSAWSWVWASSLMPYRYAAGSYIQYHNNSGTMTTGQNNRYYNSYLLITNVNGASRFAFVMGNEYTTLALAQAETFSSLTLTNLNINEFVACYQITWYANSSYTTLGKVRLAVTPKPISTSAVGNTLAGGTIAAVNVSFVPTSGLPASVTNVQSAIEHVIGFNRVLGSNLTLEDTECLFVYRYLTIGAYSLTLDGDADLVII